jgi:anaerobic ribonucleoside-triphosphate reductase
MEIKKNITSIFMVPTLKVPKDALRGNGFINAYIKDNRKDDDYKDSIYLLFKPTDIDKFREFLENEYERTKNVIEDYDYEDGYVVVVYQLDKKYNKDFMLIKEGKYSKTSVEFQKLFPKIIKIVKNGLNRDELSLQYRIFNKSEELIEFWEEKLGIDLKSTIGNDFEVWEGWDEQREILELDKIKDLLCVTEKS